jgi:hypothetical protein
MTTPRKVNFKEELMDFRVAVLGALGWSTAAIVSKTSLTPCQVTYRLKKASLKRSDYRSGYSGIAEYLFSKAGKLGIEDQVVTVLDRQGLV